MERDRGAPLENPREGMGFRERMARQARSTSPRLAPSFLQMVGISLAGSAIVEKIFSLPGLGYSIVDSVLYRDTPMIHATILFLAFFLVICNTVSDILQRIFQRGHAEGAVQ